MVLWRTMSLSRVSQDTYPEYPCSYGLQSQAYARDSCASRCQMAQNDRPWRAIALEGRERVLIPKLKNRREWSKTHQEQARRKNSRFVQWSLIVSKVLQSTYKFEMHFKNLSKSGNLLKFALKLQR